jgi:hypothetical protein
VRQQAYGGRQAQLEAGAFAGLPFAFERAALIFDQRPRGGQAKPDSERLAGHERLEQEGDLFL